MDQEAVEILSKFFMCAIALKDAYWKVTHNEGCPRNFCEVYRHFLEVQEKVKSLMEVIEAGQCPFCTERKPLKSARDSILEL